MVVLADMLWCVVRYGAGPTDYRAMKFAIQPAWRRKTFVTRGANNDYIKRLNRREDYHLLENKVHFNELFAEHIGRQWCDLSRATEEEFVNFLTSDLRPLTSIIVKPLDSLCGAGIEKITITAETDIPALYKQLKSSGQLLAEECLIQHPDLARIYPPSVNTLRFTSVQGTDELHFMLRVLRMGAGGNVMDNTDTGGLYAYTNDEGEIITPAFNYKEEAHEKHPDTGEQILGVRVPFYREAIQLVTICQRLVPNLRYIGWDVAITPTGPVLIEGNHNPAYLAFQKVQYMAENEPGKRPLFEQIIARTRP